MTGYLFRSVSGRLVPNLNGRVHFPQPRLHYDVGQSTQELL